MTYRILALDGGGVWALVQVLALIELYRDCGGDQVAGHEVLADFDMAAANSGGAIVLGGLVADMKLAEIRDLFLDDDQRHNLFRPTKSVVDTVVRWVLRTAPKYDTKAKLDALRGILKARGDKSMVEAAADVICTATNKPVHLLITAFDFDREVACFFRSADVGFPGWGEGGASTTGTLAEAIHASSTAPVAYFDAPAVFGPDRYWDGGVAGCNNPVLAAVAEALVMQVKSTDVAALSLGTGTKRLPEAPADNPPPLQAARSSQGLIPDLGKLAGSITDDPPDVASFLAHVMTGGPLDPAHPEAGGRVVRMSPMISPIRDAAGKWTPPPGWSIPKFTALSKLALDTLEQPDVEMIAEFANLWIADQTLNQPVRMHIDSLTPEIGAEFFTQAKKAWEALAGPARRSGRPPQTDAA